MPTFKKSAFAKKVGTVKAKPVKVWAGPCDPGPTGGITQSGISAFLVCRERFRLRWIEGLHTEDRFNHRLEYGSMWHICEEAFAKGCTFGICFSKLREYCETLCKRYPLQSDEIDKWMWVCKTQFPHYVAYWAKHPDVKDRQPLLQEQVFHVPYTLLSGRTVYLRGKWDSVDLIGKKIWLQENKTKGDVDEVLLRRQLTFDLQTMVYIIALYEWQHDVAQDSPPDDPFTRPITGVRYNVIRRPLSGGKGSIKWNEAKESKEEYYNRLAQYFVEEPEYWFMRLKVEIFPADIERFKRECLNPVLEQLCDWYEMMETGDAYKGDLHYRMPYGIYSPIADGVPTETDEFLASGSEAGLQRGVPLFGELQ